jgi:hypothetical protein
MNPTLTRSPDGIQVLVFSWNVGNAMPDPAELSEWLPSASDRPWDLVVVGVQECSFRASKKGADMPSSLQAGSSIQEASLHDSVASMPEPEDLEEPPKLEPEKSWTQKEHEKDAPLWDEMVAKQLGSKYKVVATVVLWQMRLSVYAKAEHMHGASACIHHVQTAVSATGVGGFMGNKGGLVVKLDFGQTSLVFVSSHLAAHSHKLEQRNQNCQEILRETQNSIGAPTPPRVAHPPRVARLRSGLGVLLPSWEPTPGSLLLGAYSWEPTPGSLLLGAYSWEPTPGSLLRLTSGCAHAHVPSSCCRRPPPSALRHHLPATALP